MDDCFYNTDIYTISVTSLLSLHVYERTLLSGGGGDGDGVTAGSWAESAV